MGAENSVLEGCEWGEDLGECNVNWFLQHAAAKDGRQVTVFQPKKGERKYNDMIQQLAQNLKTLRHPNVLRFVGAGHSSDGFHLVTERAVPLVTVLDQLSSYDICSGLYDVLDALTFLHDKVGVCHNNIGIDAIFVASDGSWRLGELQHTCPFASVSTEYLEMCRAFREQASVAPEEKDGKIEVNSGQGHARDMYGFGVCAKILLEHLGTQGEIKISDSFEQRVEACLSPDPALRPPALTLKNDSIFQNDFVQILSFVRSVALKTSEEKVDFFSGLLPRLLALPEEVIGRRLAVPLLSRFVLMDETAVSHVIPHLLTPSHDDPATRTFPLGVTPLLSTSAFEKYVIPELLRIFSVREAHVRMVLLSHFSQYVVLFDKETLQDHVFPQLLLGLRDTTDAIVAASLRAVADLVPLLGADTVIGGKRATIFFHGMPKFTDRVKADEKLPSSIKEVLHPVMSLSISKPLLKDLVDISSHTEGKKKHAEHEKRRAEAWKKREERQLQMKQQQARLKSLGGDEANAKTATLLEISKNYVADQSEEIGNDGEDDASPKASHEDQFDEHKTEEQEGKLETNEDTWSDWEDKDAAGLISSRDDLISQEIEAELAYMSGGSYPLPANGLRNKVQTSPDPYDARNPQLNGDMWQSATSNNANSKSVLLDGMLKQKTVISVQEMLESTEASIVNSHVSVDAVGHFTAKEKFIQGKGMKLPSKAKPAVSGKKSAQSDDLGAGYDIKSVELTLVSSEVDYFADMTPKISMTVGPLISSESGGVIIEEKNACSQAVSTLFAVAATSITEDAAGWGDDADWGGDSE